MNKYHFEKHHTTGYRIQLIRLVGLLSSILHITTNNYNELIHISIKMLMVDINIPILPCVSFNRTVAMNWLMMCVDADQWHGLFYFLIQLFESHVVVRIRESSLIFLVFNNCSKLMTLFMFVVIK